MKPTDFSFFEKAFNKSVQAPTVALLGEIVTILKKEDRRRVG
jgi:hypothetical protein